MLDFTQTQVEFIGIFRRAAEFRAVARQDRAKSPACDPRRTARPRYRPLRGDTPCRPL